MIINCYEIGVNCFCLFVIVEIILSVNDKVIVVGYGWSLYWYELILVKINFLRFFKKIIINYIDLLYEKFFFM